MKTNLRRIFFALLIAVLISGNLFQGSSAGGQTPAPVSKEEPQVGHNPDTGKVSFIGGGAPINVPGASGVRAASPEQKAMAAANIYGPQFGLKNPSQELQLSKTGEDGNGHAITRYQQVYQGIPVLAGEMIFNMNSNGDLLSVSGEVSSDLSLDTQPRISADEARRTAVGATAKWYKIDASSLTVSKPELQIFDESLLKASVLPPQLVWSMEVTATSSQPIREMVLVNAQTGAISLHINQIDTMGVTKPESQSPMPEPSLKAPPIPADIQGGAKVSNSPASNLAAGGATWYVATTGNDSNTCSTTSAPCLTINGALGKAASGDAINVASGTYTGTGFYVVTITKSIRILGGWDAAFTIQNGQSIIDGQASRSGIYINGTGLTVDISQFKVTNGGGSDGVAVYDKNTSGTTNFNRVALVSNQGNGIYNYAGNANFTNGTISGNHAGWAGSAISNVSGNINIQFSTITNNTGTFDYAIWSPNGGANIEIGSSILAGNNIGDCWANMTSDGYNIFGRLPACNNSFTLKPTDKVGTDPQISPLTGDGFHAISGSSPAITAANPATCPATDQRGIIRPYGTGCDIGAYEYTPAGTAAAIYPAGGSDQAVGLNQPSLSPLKAFVTDNIGAPVPGATVTFTAPALGASGIFSDSGTNTTTAITDNTGIATAATYTANELSGTYNIAASTTGVTGTANFSITNEIFYVSPSGSDSADCLTPASACLTINQAMAKAPPGVGIRVATGTYTGSGTYVVTISKSIQILGGWDAAFITRNGQSIIDGQASRSGIYIHGSNLAVDISQVTVQNSKGSAVYDNNAGGTTNFNRVVITNSSANGSYNAQGIYNLYGNINITNSTLSGNHSGGIGGSAISNVDGNINVQFSTITNNSGSGTNNYAIYGLNGGSHIEIGNSILAGNAYSDCMANIISDGHNIFGRYPACGNVITTQPSDQVGVDPFIGTLTAGGYHVLLPGSPAIDNADSATCPATDQRGTTRPQGSACDIGAVEYQPGTTPASVYVFRGSPQSIRINTAAPTNLAAAVADANGAGVQGITVTFTAPASGASGVFSNLSRITTAVTGFNGIATASTYTANSTQGSYSILATVSGLPTPATFSITNLPPVDIQTYNMNHSGDEALLPGTFVCDLSQPNCTSGPDADVNHATQYAYDTYNFYKTHFGRNSIDNADMTIVSSVHFGNNYQNAFWNGYQMVYGEGFVADDVVGHELTHGVTQFTSQLIYAYQSGAIDESLSDVFGEFVDQTNGSGNDSPGVKWLLGEDLPIGAIRSMSNPPAYGDPDRMTSPNFYTGVGDDGGVHTNSGVNNKAAFLMTDGGFFNSKTVSGIGLNKTAAIYYRVETNFLGAGANYTDLYFAIHQACLNLVGGSDGITSGDCDQVQNAIDAVEMNVKPSQAYTPNPDDCAAGASVVSTLFSDDMEHGTGNWSFGSGWNFQTPGIKSPSHSLVGPDPWYVTDTSTAMSADISVPTFDKPMLYFNHYFELDAYYDVNWNLVEAYDGGVVEYSTNHGATWQDASPLFSAGQNYNGTLLGIYGNPLGGRRAFTGLSNGMVGSRYDLSSLRGNPVRFRWRIGTDDSVGYAGWYIDDVRIYTCPGIPPAVALTSPSGSIGMNYNPTFTWTQASTATWYLLQVNTDSPNKAVIYQWYTSAQANCNGTTCSVTPTTTLDGGAYTWWVVANNSFGDGMWSTGMSFSVTPPPVPGAVTLVTPNGDIGTNHNPTYTWNKVSEATWYLLQVNGPSGTVIYNWYTSAQAGCGVTTCSVTPTTTLTAGAHSWKVQTYNSSGYGPWSAEMNFSTTIVTKPGAATPLTPTGDLGSNYSPTYTWNQVSGATWYLLQVNGPSGTVIYNWYTSAQAGCGITTCSVTPATTLGGGAYTWWVLANNSAGDGPWSTGMNFSTTIPGKLGPATQVSPTGSIGADHTPTYTWSQVSGSTWYLLQVNANTPNHTVIYNWYTSAQVGCNGTTCSVTPTTNLPAGSYTWWVLTYSTTDGTWSSGMGFTVSP